MWTLIEIAFRNVARNRRRTLITLAALLVGVGVMVSIRGLLSGFQRGLVLGVVQGQVGAIQVHKKGFLANVLSNPISLDFPAEEVLEKVRSVPGVEHASARIPFAGLLSSGDETLFFAVTGVDPVNEYKVCPRRSQTFEATRDDDVAQGLIVTTELGRGLKIKPGEEAALLASDKDGSLNGENVKLAGTMKLSLPGEKKVGLVPLEVAQRVLRMEGRATEIAISVPEDSIDDVKGLVERLREKLGPEYEVNSWEDIAVFVRETQSRQNFFIKIIAAVFMVLMLLGVANTMLMSVIERTREVGTMMAVGVRRSQIMGLFLFEAMGLGAIGGVIGAAAGWGIVGAIAAKGLEVHAPGQNVPFTIRPYVSFEYMTTVVVIAALGSMVFALYPAWRASRLRPVEALSGG